MGAIKHHSLLSAADFLWGKEKMRSVVIGKTVAHEAGSHPSPRVYLWASHFLSNAQTLLVALTGHVNTHTLHMMKRSSTTSVVT